MLPHFVYNEAEEIKRIGFRERPHEADRGTAFYAIVKNISERRKVVRCLLDGKAEYQQHSESHHLQDQALQIMRFGNGEQDGVILRLCAAFQDSQLLADIESSRCHNFE